VADFQLLSKVGPSGRWHVESLVRGVQGVSAGARAIDGVPWSPTRPAVRTRGHAPTVGLRRGVPSRQGANPTFEERDVAHLRTGRKARGHRIHKGPGQPQSEVQRYVEVPLLPKSLLRRTTDERVVEMRSSSPRTVSRRPMRQVSVMVAACEVAEPAELVNTALTSQPFSRALSPDTVKVVEV
jgi:hypothetical protein